MSSQGKQKTSLGTKIFVSFFLVIFTLGIVISTVAQRLLRNALETNGVDSALVSEITQHFTVAVQGSVMLAMFLVIVLSYFLARNITSPLKNLNKTAHSIISGDLSRRARVETNDEIGELASSFNSMMTEIQKQSTSLEEAKTKAETVLQSIGDGVLVVNQGMKVVTMNLAAAEMTDCLPNMAKGRKYTEFFDFRFDESALRNDVFIKRSIKNKEVAKDSDYSLLVTKTGKKRYVTNSASPLINEKGEVDGAVIVFRDATLDREIEQMKNDFVSLASHQLRTPLTAIKLFSEKLLDDQKKQKLPESNQEDYLSNIAFSVDRMVKLVNDMLNVTRIESGRLRINPEKVSIEKIVENLINEAEPLTSEKGVEIKFEKKQKLPEIKIDIILFRQVVHNLIVNAIRYASLEKPSVTIILDKKKEEASLSVKDNGIGIPEEVQSRIFEKFYRANNAIKKETEGTGLGLYTAKMIMEASGGKISFSSRLGQGSEFVVTLPLSGMKSKKGSSGLSIS